MTKYTVWFPVLYAHYLLPVQEMHSIPNKSCDRKVNELVKRVRALRVHLLLLKHLKAKMPALLFKESTQAKILEEMPQHFISVRQSLI
jgi:EH domain-containing protein 1